MTSNEIQLPAGVAMPDRLGQATVVEQSRAIAEVQGAILVAQRCPRDVPGAVAAMRESCKQKTLADRAFFKFSRGGSAVSGPSVYLARELARTWGNVQYGVSEMRRDDGHGQSEMLAFAWDVQTNTRVETKFVVPHMRDTKQGAKPLTDMRDIYENNANAGARRVRECIFSILPPWFVEEAKALCYKTIEDGGGKPLPQRISDAIRVYSENLGITVDQLELRIERPSSKWTAHDVAQLSVTYQALQRGEIRKDDEFPAQPVTVEEIVGASVPEPSAPASEPRNGRARGRKQQPAAEQPDDGEQGLLPDDPDLIDPEAEVRA